MKRAEVFTPNNLPSVTFVDDHLHENMKLLHQNLEQGGAVVAISGPSKSGKTVFIETSLGRDNLIQVTGANITSPEDLWRRIFTVIGTPIPTTKTASKAKESTIGGLIEGGVPLIAKAQATFGEKTGDSNTQTVDVKPDYLTLLVKELKGTNFVVFIDDFHYIPTQVQSEIAEVIKEAVREGLRFVLAAVPYHADDVLIANSDLRGRMLKLDFNYWNEKELAKIAEKGFKVLNVTIAPSMIGAFAVEAAGSPQLMQSLCLNLCFEIDIDATFTEHKTVQADQGLINKVCRRTAQTNDYSSVMRIMREGPKIRGTDRNSYQMVDGTNADVYPILVSAIALSPPQLTLSYPQLLQRIVARCVNDHPQGSSVTGACSHISALANDAAGASIIEWDGQKDVFDIRDPYLLFALRWNEKT